MKKSHTESPVERLALLEMLLDNSRDVLYVRNLKCDRYEYVSKAVERINGYSQEEFMNLPVEDVIEMIHPDDMPAIQQFLEAFFQLETGEEFSLSVDYRLRRKDGSWTWISDSVAMVRDDRGDPLYRVGVVRDISDLKAREAELSRQEDLFFTIVDSLPQYVAHINNELEYQYVNRSFQEYFKVTPEEVIGKKAGSITRSDYAEDARELFGKVLRGEPVRFSRYFPDISGNEAYVEGVFLPLQSETGETEGFYSVITNITPYVLSQKHLRESEELHRLIVENITDAIFITDHRGKLKYVSSSVRLLFGMNKRDMNRAKGLDDLLPALVNKLGVIIKEKVVSNLRVTFQGKRGQLNIIRINAKAIDYNGPSILFHCRDVTELESKKGELIRISFLLEEKNQLLKKILETLYNVGTLGQEGCKDQILDLLEQIRETYNPEYDWELYLSHFEEIHPDYTTNLLSVNPGLTQNDIRHCVYIRMNLSTRQIARLMNIKPSSVQMARVRLKKKLRLENGNNLYSFLHTL